MNGSPEHPRFRAMEIGPGGFPADRVSAIGADGQPQPPTGVQTPPSGVQGLPSGVQGPPGSMAGDPASIGYDRGMSVPGSAVPAPSAVFGSFDNDERPSGRAVFGWLALALVVAVLVGFAFWSDSEQLSDGSGEITAGDCLMSSGDSVINIDCSSPDSEFRVAASYENSTDSDLCEKVSSDLVLVTRDDVVLCLDYLAKVGDCLYAGPAVQAGKAPCRTPGSRTTPVGLFRVIGVLRSTTDPANCPKGTVETLVHTTTREVLCLGLP